MNESAYPLQVSCNGKESLGSYQYQRHNNKDAVLQGLRMSFFALLVAGLTIAIPLVHFVTVPLGIIVAPLVGVYFYFARKGKPKSIVGDFRCPECQADNHVVTERLDACYLGKCHHCELDFKLVPLQSMGQSPG